MARRRVRMIGACLGLIAMLVGGCDLFLFESPMLEFRVSNESDAEATVTIVQPEADIGMVYAERVPADTEATISVEYPGPDAWTLLVNEVPATNSTEWPADNPTLDFTIVIHQGGTVEVVDD